MKRVECYRADNGELESKLDRAKAADLHYALPKADHNPNAKVMDWNDCLHIMEHADIVMTHLKEFIELRDKSAQ
ncbi:hypothetical protein [Agrobacterium tumefaciens]|uniref:hypothetical protein n=1 Tax=Agrobacterium tumefaciens TaxID=358 RepID=UPI001574DA93|nr:hypothetical protein [Agrobacterium tumefaciens]